MKDETAAAGAAENEPATPSKDVAGPDETPSSAGREWVRYAVLAGILLLAFAVRAYRIGALDGGYHVFNEGFYLKMAAQELTRGAFDWLSKPLDLMNPPLYAMVVSLAFRVFGVSLGVARAVSVISGVLTVLYVYLTGKLLYRQRAGLIAAALLAVMPGVALVNRNNQVDSLMVLFCIAGVYHYCRALSDENNGQALLGGILLGLGLATKLPAVLVLGVLAVWTTIITPGIGWLKRRGTWLFAGGFAVTGLPWYAYQLLANNAAYTGAQRSVTSTAVREATVASLAESGNELMWMVMPATLVVIIVAIGFLLYKRSRGDTLVLLGAAAPAVFYLVFNFHSYYLLPLTPFLALAGGRLVTAMSRRVPRITWVSLAVLLLTMFVATLAMLAGNKYGNWSPQSIPAAAGGMDSSAVVYSTPEIQGSYQPMVEYAVQPAKVVWLPQQFSGDDVTVPPGGRAYILTTTIFADDADKDLAPMLQFPEQQWSFNFMGFSFTQMPRNRHFFAAKDVDVSWEGTPFFGFTHSTYTTGINLYDVATLRQQTGKQP